MVIDILNVNLTLINIMNNLFPILCVIAILLLFIFIYNLITDIRIYKIGNYIVERDQVIQEQRKLIYKEIVKIKDIIIDKTI